METYAAICTYLFLLFDTFIILECRIGFPKDMQMDFDFPPKFNPSTIKGVPTGHLWHFGHQSIPSGKVTELVGMPDAHTFHMKYVKQGRLLHIKESFKDLPIYETWKNDTLFENKFGLLKLLTTIKKNRSQFEDRLMTVKKFLLDYMHEEWWVASTMPYDIAKEIPIPRCLQCGTNRQGLQEAELWTSAGRTSLRIHTRDDHNLHCVLFGRKDFILIDRKYKDSFDFADAYKDSVAGISKINVESVNMFTHKDIADIPWTYATLRQGDCLFIPAGYIQQIRSYGRAISFSMLFAPSTKFDSSDCKQWLGDKVEPENLSDAAYVWVFRDAKRELSAMRMEPDILKKYLILLLRADSKISYERFEHFYDQALLHYPDHPPAREAFNILTGGDYKKTKITRDQLENLNPNKLLKLSKILNDARAKQSVFERDEL